MDQTTDSDLISLRGISKAFAGVQALDDVSLTIGRGEIVCLAGENGSGKSTLIKILAGAQAADKGEITLNDKAYRRVSPIEAVHEGIQVIFQDFSLFPNLTVAENIALNDALSHGRALVDWRGVHRTAREALDKVGVDIDLDARVENLPVADKQLVAIARALVGDARLIVMDEPTTALTEREVRTLLGIIRRLQQDGVSVLFVSHKLNEVFEVCEKIAVLRNGRKVADGPVGDFDLESLTFHMTGRRFSADGEKRAIPQDARELMRVEALGKKDGFQEVSFSLLAGEVLGVAGLLGSGRTELAEALFGLRPADSGRIFIEGEPVALRDVRHAINCGIGYVPEDRLTEGLFLPQAIERNIVVGSIDRLAGRSGFLDFGAMRRQVDEWLDNLKIATPSARSPVQSLSGGNQQRVMLARWLATEPRILILNGPTVGVDVGSKVDIHEIIDDLARKGIGVIVISDDIPELLRACDRILIMKAGRVVEEVGQADTSESGLARRLVS
ncbi:sugar ABC transporter ATP-binding protein [Inquilinus sp. CAU 1745]|uniref:sugar ABC transporter ATP-binding protein n=1 Tax=Inquilinus sp. CAU 1745 TaxID=3140369 RepID=UPI00325AE00B